MNYSAYNKLSKDLGNVIDELLAIEKSAYESTKVPVSCDLQIRAKLFNARCLLNNIILDISE